MSRTGLAARLFSHEEEPLLAMNPADMRARALRTGALVRVKSRRGDIAVRVRASDQVRAGQAYLPMHWGGRFMRGGGINTLTLPALDPVSRQPELKHTAVQVEKLDCPWEVFAVRSGDAVALLERVQPLLDDFPYATCGLHGRERSALVFRAAAPAPVDQSVIDRLDAALCLDDASRAMDYRDARRGIAKRVLVEVGIVTGVRLTGETAARDWLKELCADGAPAAHLRNWMLAPVGTAPAGEPRRGRVLCNCLDVAERDIRERIAAGASLPTLQGELACGTRCGSCLPEIRRLIAEHAPVHAH
jgi:assimilatory nitrate reductase catalytic subunit